MFLTTCAIFGAIQMFLTTCAIFGAIQMFLTTCAIFGGIQMFLTSCAIFVGKQTNKKNSPVAMEYIYMAALYQIERNGQSSLVYVLYVAIVNTLY